jgi:hypothetical protein
MAKTDNGLVAANAHGVSARSEHWAEVEKEYKTKNPNCIACDPKNYGKVGIQIHHTFYPFHIAILAGRPDLELDERNLRSLCETEKDKPAPNHHILLGHLKNFRSWNPNLDTDAQKYKGMTEEQILAQQDYLTEESKRPDPDKAEQKDFLKALRIEMDTKFPPNSELLKKFNITLKPFE